MRNTAAFTSILLLLPLLFLYFSCATKILAFNNNPTTTSLQPLPCYQHQHYYRRSASATRRNHQQHPPTTPTTTTTSPTTNGGAGSLITMAGIRNPEEDTKDTTTTSGGGGIASVPNLSLSLCKSIVGSGVLALPAAVSALGDSPQMIVPAAVIILAIGLINGYFFSLIGEVCSRTNISGGGYRDAWERTVGEGSQWVAIAVMLKTALSCLAFSMIIADSVQSLATATGFFVDGISRTQALEAVTVFALLPLCLLRDLTSLAPFSFAGLVGMGFTTVAMVIRWLDGSYVVPSSSSVVGGTSTNYIQDIPQNLLPSFDLSPGPNIEGLVLACTLATAFVAHYNAPRFYNELSDNTMERFNSVVAVSFGVSAIVFIMVAAAGFLTFGSGSNGLILNNYSPYDPLISLSRAAVALSLIFTYPLPFVGFRDGVLDVMQVKQQDRTDTFISTVSVVLLAVITGLAMIVRDLALVLSVGGGTFSTAVTAVFPTLMYKAIAEKEKDEEPQLKTVFTEVLMWLCIAIGASGVFLALEKA